MTNLDGLKRILIVDDERFMRLTIRAALKALGRFNVTDADDGDTALAEVESTRPDVVLCDITMPRMGGLRFVERLRDHANVAIRETPVIILTGHGEGAMVSAASKLRINGYLVKPVSPKQLGDQLHKIVAARRVAPLSTVASESSSTPA